MNVKLTPYEMDSWLAHDKSSMNTSKSSKQTEFIFNHKCEFLDSYQFIVKNGDSYRS